MHSDDPWHSPLRVLKSRRQSLSVHQDLQSTSVGCATGCAVVVRQSKYFLTTQPSAAPVIRTHCFPLWSYCVPTILTEAPLRTVFRIVPNGASLTFSGVPVGSATIHAKVGACGTTIRMMAPAIMVSSRIIASLSQMGDRCLGAPDIFIRILHKSFSVLNPIFICTPKVACTDSSSREETIGLAYGNV